MFFITMLVFVVIAIGVTYKVMVGYTNFGFWARFAVFLLLGAAWFSPVLIRLIRKLPPAFNGTFYDISYKTLYFLMGLALVLFFMIVVRDVVWQIIYFISKSQSLDPNNVHAINVLNIITLALAFVVCLYGVYEAHNKLEVHTLNIQDARIKKPVNIVVASDFHINQSTPLWHIDKIIKQINAQNPDYVLLVGDTADDEPEYARKKIKHLKKIRAKKVFISLGNHEYYHRPYSWMESFFDLGFTIIHNSGEKLEDTGVFVAGVPDVGSARVSYERAFEEAGDEYKILMSHSPTDFKTLNQDMFDIQVSGHTHGGQIFPFQYITKQVNDGYLSGLYQEKAKLFVLKGAGYWGPPMRLNAAPDIAVLKLSPAKEN